jgi:hypothetical protein
MTADEDLARFSARSVEQGFRAWGPEDVTPPAAHRLYRANVVEAYVLDPHDRRSPVTLG